MKPGWNEISDQIHKLVTHLPEAWVFKIANRLIAASEIQQQFLETELIGMLPKSSSRVLVSDLLQLCLSSDLQIKPDALGYAILTASKNEAYHHRAGQMELVWTGPSTQAIPLRRTDQAVLQVINEAQHRLFLVSFAVYKIRKIVAALKLAVGRGVDLSILVESSDESAGKLTYDAINAFGEVLHQLATFYIWPYDKRERSEDAKSGIIHAKAAVADGKVLFISSANLTEYAMNLNMEMGVLIHGGDLPLQVEKQFDYLIDEEVIIPVPKRSHR